MAMSSPSGQGIMSDPNITPLVDVLLVLLIIFMIITPIIQKGFYTQVPPKAPPTTTPTAQTNVIVLQMSANGAMAINKQPVTMQALGDRLGAIYATRADKVLFVDADDNVIYGRVVKALDIAHGPGKVKTIGFVVN